MKNTVITLLALIVSASAFSASTGGSRSGLPEGNCYKDGELIGSMTITECQAKGGKFNNPTKD